MSDIYGGPTDYVFMAFDDKFLKAHQAAVRDYIEDYLLAVNWALDNRAEAVKIYAGGMETAIRRWSIAICSPRRTTWCAGAASCRAKNIQPIVDGLAANGFIGQSFDVSKYIDLSYLPQAR